MTHFLFGTSAIAHAAAYSLAAVYAHLTESHSDMCPVYVVIAVAALLHLVAVFLQWRAGMTPDDAPPPPLADHRRITYYDSRREPIYTEWEETPIIAPAAIIRPPADKPPAAHPNQTEQARRKAA